jgi:hypothetical protein
MGRCLLKVIVEDGDEQMIPWAVPNEEDEGDTQE